MVKVKGVIKAKFGGKFVDIPLVAGGGGGSSESDLFDATELYTASKSQSKEVTPEFLAALQGAISLNKILYINDETVPEYKVGVVIGFIEQTNEKITFAATGKGYNYNIVLDIATRRVDTTAVRMGAAFNKYINSKGNDIFSLSLESTPEQVRAVFDLNNEGPVLPDAGDTFEVYENTVTEPNLSDSGIVISRKASPTTQELNIISNNFEDQLIVVHNIVIDYGVNGFNNNVRVIRVVHSVIDPNVITDEFIHALDANLSAVKNEMNEFNISAIDGTPYASLQEAISALHAYLGERQKMVGLKMTYAESPSNLPKTYVYNGGSFVSVESWKEVGSGGGGVGQVDKTPDAVDHGEIFNAYSGDYANKATNMYSHAEGCATTASGMMSHAEGHRATSSGMASHSANSETNANGFAQTAIGYKNTPEPTPSVDSFDATKLAFVVGGGSSAETKNIFEVFFNGTTKAAGTITGATADYAEMFEWIDNNPDSEDRIGRFVNLVGEKIELANNNSDNIIGIISGNPVILGDAPNSWQGMYLNDEWGRPTYTDHEFEVERQKFNKETGKVETVTEIKKSHARSINQNYDSSLVYTPREERPEWAAVGMLGKLLVLQDGTLSVGGRCYPSQNGIATKSDKGYYVMKVINEHQALILFR